MRSDPFTWPNRRFAAHFGVAKQTVHILWLHLQSVISDIRIEQKHLLWSLYFLKVYTTNDVSAVHWGVDPKTFSQWVWKILLILDATLNLVRYSTFQSLIVQVDITDRYFGGNRLVNVALDVTECPIHKPLDYEEQLKYYSGKSGMHSIKYELAVEISTGFIVWFWGPCYGSVHDLTIVRQSGIISLLSADELIMADKAYIGEPKIVTAFKQPQTDIERAINSIFYSHRTIVENAFGRFKNFGFTQKEWRHQPELHFIAMKCLVNILNIDLVFRPLRK
jgi:hypothetical protein